MKRSGGQPGNQNARKENRLWADEIRKVLVQGKKLRPLAEKLVSLAEAGDMSALKEIGDRIDGKPAQTVQADVGGSLTVKIEGNLAKVL